jgi:hypothetical protein
MQGQAVSGARLCRCDHDRESHEHYRAGKDCSAGGCTCVRFRRPSLFARLLGAAALAHVPRQRGRGPSVVTGGLEVAGSGELLA